MDADRPALGADEPQADAMPEGAGLDRDAIERLWRDNRRWIAAVLIAHKPAACDLDDLLQEVAATLVAKAHTIRCEEAARGWLRVVAVNVARLHGRKRTRRGEDQREVVRDDDPRYADRLEPAERLAERELGQRLAALPETYREPLMLRAVRGLPSATIGEILGLSEAAVNTRLARARRMLRGTLPARDDTPAPTRSPIDAEREDPS